MGPPGSDADVTDHEAAPDPHPGYRREDVAITAADVAADVATQAELDGHTGAAAPHVGHETPAGAQAKVDAHRDVAAPHAGHLTVAHTDAGDPHPGYRLEADSPVDPVAGTPGLRTLGAGAQQAGAGNDARFSDQRVPLDATVTNAKVAAAAAISESKLALASNAARTVASRRTLGTGATEAFPGDLSPRTSFRHVTAQYLYEAGQHSALYEAEKRFAVTLTNFTTPNARLLFDGAYETHGSNQVEANTTATIYVDLLAKGEITNWITYPYGSFYFVWYSSTGTGPTNLAITGRQLDKDGIWHNLVGTSISDRVWEVPVVKPYATAFEFSIAAGAERTQYGLVEVEWKLTRAGSTPAALLTKRADVQSLYGAHSFRDANNVEQARIGGGARSGTDTIPNSDGTAADNQRAVNAVLAYLRRSGQIAT
jgi:hypothetical protein